ncbi:MAG TPA: SDR family oxidoreductase [Burkholderiaceae bacterium]|jgi:NAD(P)-dependent dehydrogenase (short-subunit alcohol dehydrogenase family)
MKDRIAVVTGASQGIGRATAIRLARDFAAVALVARDERKLRETEREVVDAGARALVVAADLSDASSASEVVKLAGAAFGRIDALVNIAGAVPQVDVLEMTDEQWDQGLALKLHGARRLTVQAWPALQASRGFVVFTSGNSALFPKAGYAAVGTVNAAIVALSKAFADKGLSSGIRVNSVLPGPVMTGRRRSYLERWAAAHGMSVEDATLRFPKDAGIARYGEPQEIAELMAFLVSPAAQWMTGAALRMDGGEVKAV